MRKTVITALLAAALLVSCRHRARGTDAAAHSRADEAEAAPAAADGAGLEALAEGGPELRAFVDVLENRAAFHSALAGEDLSFSDYTGRYYPDAEDGILYAVVDMDGDGAPELVLAFPGSGDQEVLRLQDGVVYGYNFGLRSLNDLKADGSSAWANSAFDAGYGAWAFHGADCALVELARVQLFEDGSAAYRVGGEPATEAEYEAFARAQDEKEDAVWHPLDG